MGARITAEKRKEMFETWLEKPTICYVSKKCGIAEGSVRKYRDLDNWKERAQKVTSKVIDKVETKVANELTRHVRLAQAMQAKGGSSLLSLPVVAIDEARKLIVDGVRLEREILGQSPQEIDIKIKLPPGMKIEDVT